LQDCETDTNKAGYIVVKNKTDNSEIGTYSTSSGSFSFTLPKLVSELPDGVVLEARLGTTSSPTSYIRKVALSSGDKSGLIVRTVPYNSSDIDGNGIITTNDDSKYQEQIEDINIVLGRGLVKYDITDVGILMKNPLTEDEIDSGEKSNLESAINQWSTILSSARADRKTLNIITPIAGVDYDSITLKPRKGLILLVQDNRVEPASGDTALYTYTNPFIIESALCRFDSTGSLNATTIPLHELGHALFSAFHSGAGIPSIMSTPINTTKIEEVDKKAMKTIYEETYLPEEKLDDILGL
jgi:hypothetical protein